LSELARGRACALRQRKNRASTDTAAGARIPSEGLQSRHRLGTFSLNQLDAAVCGQYTRARRADAATRRELEDLRAAVGYYCKRKRILNPAEIVLPERGDARDRWLSREEAAKLVWAAWRLRQNWKGQLSDRTTGHVARFILMAL
jgi:hypothetical protein